MSLQESDRLAGEVAVAPRVTLADIERAIKARYDVTAAQAVGASPSVRALASVALCIVVTENDWVVVGKSAPVSPENYNAELGRKFAYEDAIRQLWPLLGYVLKEQLRAD